MTHKKIKIVGVSNFTSKPQLTQDEKKEIQEDHYENSEVTEVTSASQSKY